MYTNFLMGFSQVSAATLPTKKKNSEPVCTDIDIYSLLVICHTVGQPIGVWANSCP